jgi:hypothetical protein
MAAIAFPFCAMMANPTAMMTGMRMMMKGPFSK